MTCGCGASCAAGACCAGAASAGAIVACMASINAANLANMDEDELQPLDILCKNCKHEVGDHNHKGCSYEEGFWHKTKCTCKHFNFDNDKLEKAKNEIIEVLFKHLKKANELQNDEVVQQ